MEATDFSNFIRNASEDRRRDVFEAVIDEACAMQLTKVANGKLELIRKVQPRGKN